MKIQVTKKHIESGIGNTISACPIALALIERSPKFENVAVAERFISLYTKSVRKHIALPKKVGRWIIRFDSWYDNKEREKKPRGFTFNLKIPK